MFSNNKYEQQLTTKDTIEVLESNLKSNRLYMSVLNAIETILWAYESEKNPEAITYKHRQKMTINNALYILDSRMNYEREEDEDLDLADAIESIFWEIQKEREFNKNKGIDCLNLDAKYYIFPNFTVLDKPKEFGELFKDDEIHVMLYSFEEENGKVVLGKFQEPKKYLGDFMWEKGCQIIIDTHMLVYGYRYIQNFDEKPYLEILIKENIRV